MTKTLEQEALDAAATVSEWEFAILCDGTPSQVGPSDTDCRKLAALLIRIAPLLREREPMAWITVYCPDPDSPKVREIITDPAEAKRRSGKPSAYTITPLYPTAPGGQSDG